MATITENELAKHTQPGDLWMAVDGDVYDVSKFARFHPGGARILEQYAGRDVSTDFYELHKKDVLSRYARLRVGRLLGAATDATSRSVDISATPYSEIPGLMDGRHSPYYDESHKKLAVAVRRFVREELEPIAEQADLAGTYPETELQRKLGMTGILAARMGPGPWMKQLHRCGIQLPGGVDPDRFDYFHEMVVHQEIARLGRPGFIDSLGTGYFISAPAVYNFGTQAMIDELGPQLLSGKKWSALAITEPFAGSDVAAVRTTATRAPDGKHFEVTGIKKWITEGMYADYFVTAVRTSKEPGAKGLSMLLIPRSEGLETRQLKTTYSTCCGTSLVMLNSVKVPVENVMGKEGEGFKQIMFNFNHERWMIVQVLMGMARQAVADTFLWARQRKIFGKELIDQPVIRNKLASAGAALESVNAYLESVTYEMTKAPRGPQDDALAGTIALLKYQSTRACLKIADDVVQVFGGRGITRTGMGGKVEGFKNFVKYAAVYGGSEEIMAELSIKQALKAVPQQARL